MESKIRTEMNVLLELFNSDWELIDTRNTHNIVVAVGTTHIADQLSSTPSETAMGYMALGLGSTAVSSTDTTLESEVGASRIVLASRTHVASVVTYTCTFSAGVGTGVLREAGIFNNSIGGTLLARAVFDTMTKGSLDTLAITWTLTISDDNI